MRYFECQYNFCAVTINLSSAACCHEVCIIMLSKELNMRVINSFYFGAFQKCCRVEILIYIFQIK